MPCSDSKGKSASSGGMVGGDMWMNTTNTAIGNRSRSMALDCRLSMSESSVLLAEVSDNDGLFRNMLLVYMPRLRQQKNETIIEKAGAVCCLSRCFKAFEPAHHAKDKQPTPRKFNM